MEIICEKCKNSHDGKYGSGRFCSVFCAMSRSSSVVEEFICETCGCLSTDKLRRDRYKKCSKCRKKRIVKKESKSILDFSKRTVTKILKRAQLCCAICNWNETSLDLHHIKEKKNGGTDELSNLVPLCPNCHRKCHENKIQSKDLEEKSLFHTFPNWKEYYNIKLPS